MSSPLVSSVVCLGVAVLRGKKGLVGENTGAAGCSEHIHKHRASHDRMIGPFATRTMTRNGEDFCADLPFAYKGGLSSTLLATMSMGFTDPKNEFDVTTWGQAAAAENILPSGSPLST